jgi:hypothetical protein
MPDANLEPFYSSCSHTTRSSGKYEPPFLGNEDEDSTVS